jgi:hypothetical protein
MFTTFPAGLVLGPELACPEFVERAEGAGPGAPGLASAGQAAGTRAPRQIIALRQRIMVVSGGGRCPPAVVPLQTLTLLQEIMRDTMIPT